MRIYTKVTNSNFKISNTEIDNVIDCIFNSDKGIYAIGKKLGCVEENENGKLEFSSIIQTNNSNNFAVDYLSLSESQLIGFRQTCYDELSDEQLHISKYNNNLNSENTKDTQTLAIFNNWDNVNWQVISYSETLNTITVGFGDSSCSIIVTAWNKENEWSSKSNIYLITNILHSYTSVQFSNNLVLSSIHPKIPILT